MNINDAIIYLMTASAIVGAADRIFGNRLGMGEKFEEGIMAIGALALSMVGIIALSPVLANLFKTNHCACIYLFRCRSVGFCGYAACQ